MADRRRGHGVCPCTAERPGPAQQGALQAVLQGRQAAHFLPGELYMSDQDALLMASVECGADCQYPSLESNVGVQHGFQLSSVSVDTGRACSHGQLPTPFS